MNLNKKMKQKGTFPDKAGKLENERKSILQENANLENKYTKLKKDFHI